MDNHNSNNNNNNSLNGRTLEAIADGANDPPPVTTKSSHDGANKHIRGGSAHKKALQTVHASVPVTIDGQQDVGTTSPILYTGHNADSGNGGGGGASAIPGALPPLLLPSTTAPTTTIVTPTPQQLQELMSHSFPSQDQLAMLASHSAKHTIPSAFSSSSLASPSPSSYSGSSPHTPVTPVPRTNKGLRHFSMKVCEKVQQKGTTTYNDVAEELVREMAEEARAEAAAVAAAQPYQMALSSSSSSETTSPVATSTPVTTVQSSSSSGNSSTGTGSVKRGAAGGKRGGKAGNASSEEKNIRRRVYDALNVLMALKIISKDRKQIHWRGYPINYQREYERLMNIKREKMAAIDLKARHLQELGRQQNASRHLFLRNSTHPEYTNLDDSCKVMLPFIIVHTGTETVIECEMDEDGTDVFFNFSLPFEIHDDNEILYRLKLDEGVNDLPQQQPQQQQQHPKKNVEEGQHQVPMSSDKSPLHGQIDTQTAAYTSPSMDVSTGSDTSTHSRVHDRQQQHLSSVQ